MLLLLLLPEREVVVAFMMIRWQNSTLKHLLCKSRQQQHGLMEKVSGI